MINNQGYLFIIFTIDGVLIGILFDLFRILRKSFKTNDFVKGHPDTGISTMFRPVNGEDYYKQQKEEDVKNGGRV